MRSFSKQQARVLINAAIALLLICLVLLLVLWAQTAPEKPTDEAAIAGTPERSWYTTAGRDELPARFVWAATVQRPPAEGEAMRCLLMGQTLRADLILTRGGLRLIERRARDEQRLVTQKNWRRPLQKGDTIHWVAQGDGAAVFHNGIRQAFMPLPLQTWARGLWQAVTDTSPFLAFNFQAFGGVHFSDDFMHPQDELGEWVPASGEWTVHTLDNPVRSANAFSLIGKGEPALIRAGNWFWQDYTVSVSAFSVDAPNFGLRLCASEAGHYSLEVRPADGGGSSLRLLRRAGGSSSVLAEKTVDLSPQVWYRLRMSQLRGDLRVFVDDASILSARDPNPLMGGEVGLQAFDKAGIVFDDIKVSPTLEYEQDFEQQPATAGGVLDFPSSWVDASSGQLLVPAKGGDVGVHGIALENATLGCRVSAEPPVPERFELLLRGRQRGRNWVGLRVRRRRDASSAALIKAQNGRQTVLAKVPFSPAQWAGEYSLVFRDRAVYGRYKGKTLCMAADLPRGNAGSASIHVAENPAPLALSGVSLGSTAELNSLENRVETFQHEKSMSNWGSPASEWTLGPSAFGNVFWHRSDFWSEAAVSLSAEPLELNGKLPFGLVLGADAARNAPVVRLDVGIREVGSEELRARLIVNGKTRETRNLERIPAALGLERFSGRIHVFLNGKLQWTLPVPEGMQSLCRLGRYGPGEAEDWAEALRVRGHNVMTYPFKEAPVDWIPASGAWEVTNRWECDPRWSFFSGHLLDGVSSLWHKNRFPGNVTLEFFAGPKMDRSRGSHYQYAADLNAVLKADGTDIDSGYSFMFGGWDDSGSFIVRKKEVMAKSTRMRIPRTGKTHRRWFYIKIRKQGDRLTYWVENEQIGSVQDEDLLPGGRLGLWTYKNGMMIAYVRVSADIVLPPEKPRSVAEQTPSTPYDSP